MLLLPDTQDLIEVDPRKLIDLTHIPLTGAQEAQRSLSPTHLQSFLQSDPQHWPPVLTTRTDKGLLLIDGYHRREAARRRKLPMLQATVRPFGSLEGVIEAAFQANMEHGLPASGRTRSAYAYWLFVTYPDLPQTEIARRVGISPATVNIAIKRRVEQEQRKHRTTEQRQEDERRERQDTLIEAIRAYARAGTDLYRQLLRYQMHHKDEDKELALKTAFYESNTGIEQKHTLYFLSQYLLDYFQHTLPTKRANQRATLRYPSPSSEKENQVESAPDPL